jgi:hypothetical protein
MHSIKLIPLISLTVLALLFSKTTLAQKSRIKPANKSTLSKQTDTIKPTGFYACKAYFSGNGLPYVKVSDYSGPDINLLMKQIDSASNGAIVTIDDLWFVSSDGKTTIIKEIPYNFNKPKDASKYKSQAVLQVDELKSYNFVSGTIYFARFGHPNVSSAKANDTAKLNRYYAVSGPGTTITLDNCVYKNANGSLSNPVSKSIKLE